MSTYEEVCCVCDILFRVVAFCWVNSPNCAGNFIESDRKKNYCWQKMNSVMSLNHKIEVFCTYLSISIWLRTLNILWKCWNKIEDQTTKDSIMIFYFRSEFKLRFQLKIQVLIPTNCWNVLNKIDDDKYSKLQFCEWMTEFFLLTMTVPFLA